MRKGLPLILFLLMSPLVLAVNNTASDYENLIGGQLGNIIGNATWSIMLGGTTYSIDLFPLSVVLFLLIFMFIWTSASGIAWDGIYFMMLVTVAYLSSTGFFGDIGVVILGLVFAFTSLALLFYLMLRRG